MVATFTTVLILCKFHSSYNSACITENLHTYTRQATSVQQAMHLSMPICIQRPIALRSNRSRAGLRSLSTPNHHS